MTDGRSERVEPLTDDELEQVRAMLGESVSGYPVKNMVLLMGTARKLLATLDAARDAARQPAEPHIDYEIEQAMRDESFDAARQPAERFRDDVRDAFREATRTSSRQPAEQPLRNPYDPDKHFDRHVAWNEGRAATPQESPRSAEVDGLREVLIDRLADAIGRQAAIDTVDAALRAALADAE